MTIQLSKLALALAGAAMLTLAGCGGGSDSNSGGSGGGGGEPDVSKTRMSATVIDGAIQNATVCLDTNLNGSCDSGEPSGKTDAAGKVTLEVPVADVGKYPLIAMVGTDAVDADTGPVTTAYTLKAPADQALVISPLTTMVQAYLDSTGGSSADAAAAVQSQLGLSTSVFDDFTKDSTDSGKLAGTLARLIVVTTQSQLTATQGAKGLDSQPLTAAQIDAAINARLIELLPSLALTVRDDPTLSDTTLSIAEKEAQMAAAARQMADASGLTKDNIGTVVASQDKDAAAGPADEKAVDTVSLRWFSFTDLSNYLIRAFEATAAQNTPDANGKTHYTEIRERQDKGFLQEWGMGLNNWARPQIYWTGSEWFDCPTTFVHESTPVNAAGETESLYCNAMKSRSTRSNRDIAGLKMIDVVRQIRAYPAFDSAGGSFAQWGPNPDLPAIQSTLGEAVFPAGSVLSYRTVVDLGGAEYYDRTRHAQIPNSMNANTAVWSDATLAAFVGWNVGDLTGPTEVHGNNTFVLLNRDYTKLNGDGAFKRYMVGFEAAAQKARFYECEGDVKQLPARRTLFIDGKSTCEPILDTTYTIAAQGDGKVLRFAAEPAQISAANFQNHRLFVERDGVTYVGYKDKPLTSKQQRLNEPAAEALLSKLGLD